MKIIIDSKENIAELVAGIVTELAGEKPDAAIAFAAGRSTRGLYECLAESSAKLSGINAFNVCEYVGAEREKSLAYELEAGLCSKLGITKIHTPYAEAPESYDDLIASCGGLDLVILGIGLNGHIGFNEPATMYDTKTHTQLLTDSTRRMKAEHFGGVENVPETGVTMGLKTICGARKVILCAFGSEKADIVYKLVYGKTTTYVPAAMLQMHMDMILCLDAEAAAKL